MENIVWKFDRLEGIGGNPTRTEGHPQLISTPAGKAAQFNGVDDVIFVENHPLAGAANFTIEGVFRPDGGAFEQRWLHLAEADPVNGEAQSPRTLFEVRIVEDKWYSDAFTTGPGYNKTLVVPEKTFPVARWYTVQQTLEGKTYRSFVDGVLQAEAEIDFKPHGPGLTSIGMRINRVTPFKGAVLEVRFTPRALAPAAFAKLPSALKA